MDIALVFVVRSHCARSIRVLRSTGHCEPLASPGACYRRDAAPLRVTSRRQQLSLSTASVEMENPFKSFNACPAAFYSHRGIFLRRFPTRRILLRRSPVTRIGIARVGIDGDAWTRISDCGFLCICKKFERVKLQKIHPEYEKLHTNIMVFFHGVL